MPRISETTASLSSTFGRVSAIPRARGAVVFTWDDGYPSWDSHIYPLAQSLGQRHTFCVTTNRIDAGDFQVSTAKILKWFQAGHEIASHSKTHTNMAAASSATRTAEFDDSKAALEAIVGAGNVTTWAYPSGTSGGQRNDASDREAYGRYVRVLDTGHDGSLPGWCESPIPHRPHRLEFDQSRDHPGAHPLRRSNSDHRCHLRAPHLHG